MAISYGGDVATRTRPLRIAALDVAGGVAVMADAVLPLVVEVDLASGRLGPIRSWPLRDGAGDAETVTDVAIIDSEILVASPAAGGLVRLDRVSGSSSVVALERGPQRVVVADTGVWVVGENGHGLRPRKPGERRRAVVWQDPSEEEVARWREFVSRRSRVTPPSAPPEPLLSMADPPLPGFRRWAEEHDDRQDVVGRPTPLWHISGENVTELAIDGDVADLAVAGGRLVVVAWLAADRLVKVVDPSGRSVSYLRPKTVLLGDQVTGIDPIGSVGDANFGSRVIADHRRVWLLGFSRHTGDHHAASQVREIDLDGRRLMSPLAIDVTLPVAVVDDKVVDVARKGGGWTDSTPLRHELRVLTRENQLVASVDVPLIGTDLVTINDRTVWFVRREHPILAGLHIDTGMVANVDVNLNCRPWVHAPTPPEGLDLRSFEASQLAHVRSALLGGWVGADGSDTPYIRGITFESVTLDGTFPSAEIVALFHSDNRAGILFGRRWELYDDLGNTSPLDYATIGLMEDVEAAGYGLPEVDDCHPDEDGVVWF
jgi:hypothetical protein